MSAKSLVQNFASTVLRGQYEEAFQMLSGEAKDDWSPDAIKEAFEDMVEYFEGAAPRLDLEFDDEFGITKLDEGTLVYVPVVSDEGSEAISGLVDHESRIVDLEFGRP
ncbi:MAG: hypothetical protein AAFU78_13160 [Cyanobacteria bacterium J06633_2]